jgi:response regulator RpfG family c-di-GMP phosphodiesterase
MSGERVLVVDDEFHLRDSIRIVLEKEGYDVFSAASGEEALAQMEAQPAQVVISDIKMPGMDGVQLLKAIKSRYPQTEVVMLTGYPTIEAAVSAIKLGAYDYVTKPFKINTLSRTLAQALEKQRLSQEVGELKARVGVYEASKAIASTLNLDEVLNLVLKLIMQNTSARGVALYFRDQRNSELKIGAWEGIPESEAAAIQGRMKEELDLHLQEEERDYFRVRSPGLSSPGEALCYPLRSQGKILGLLLVLVSLPEEVVLREGRLLSIFASQSALALENARLHEDLTRNYFDTVRALVASIDAKDPYTRGHSENVMKLSLSITNQVELEPQERDDMKLAGLLHDVGKIGIRTETLRKEEPLTDEERREIQQHPEVGAKIIGTVGHLYRIHPLILYHHERFDGSGYPSRLKGEEIPLGARIIAVADAFDAMTNSRPYRPAKSPQEAEAEMRRESGVQFDPGVVESFFRTRSVSGEQ